MYNYFHSRYYRSELPYFSFDWIKSAYYNEDTVTIDIILGEENDE